jgi:hypothetical protein
MLNVTYKPFMLNAVMLSVMAPSDTPSFDRKTFAQRHLPNSVEKNLLANCAAHLCVALT